MEIKGYPVNPSVLPENKTLFRHPKFPVKGFESPNNEANEATPTRGLAHFLEDYNKKLMLIPSQFEINFKYSDGNSKNQDLIDYYTNKGSQHGKNGDIDLLTCFATDVSVPSIRHNFTEIFYHGQSIELPQTYEYEHDFSITVINDWRGDIYKAFVTLLKNFGGMSTVKSGLSLFIRAVGETGSIPGMKIELCGVRFKNISQLNFSYSNGNSLATFNVNCGALYFRLNDEEDSSKDEITFYEDFKNIN